MYVSEVYLTLTPIDLVEIKYLVGVMVILLLLAIHIGGTVQSGKVRAPFIYFCFSK